MYKLRGLMKWPFFLFSFFVLFFCLIRLFARIKCVCERLLFLLFYQMPSNAR